MFAQEGEVSTEADHLLRLLKEKKEISFEQMSKELALPVETIEAWANFLEEEGVVSITYKFTTPYLVLAPTAKQSPLLQLDESKAYPSGAKEKPEPIKESEIKAKVLRSSGEIDVKELSMPPIRAELSGQTSQEEKIEEMPVAEEEEPKALLEKINRLMAEEKFDEAKQIYEKLKKSYWELPDEYRRRRELMEKNLAKIDTELSVTFDTYVLKQLKEYGVKILVMIKEGRTALKRKELEKADKIYEQITELFHKLPESQMPEKRELEREVMDFSNEYFAIKQEKSAREFNSMAVVLQNLLTQLDEDLATNKVQDAIAVYSQLKQHFKGLPTGFLKAKSALQAEILKAYAVLAEKSAQLSLGRFNMIVTHIMDLLVQMKQQVLENNIVDAEESYTQIKELYSSLPEGFMAQKAQLQHQIYQVYAIFVERYPKIVSGEFNRLISEIERLLDEVRLYLRSNNYSLAAELYREIMHKFNRLPRIKTDMRMKLREEITDIYKEIILHSDSSFLSNFSKDAVESYKELLALIIKLHNHINNKDFELIEGTFRLIEDMYSKLPIAIINKQTSLRDEIAKLQQELYIYKKAKELLTPNFESEKVIALVGEINRMKEYLKRASPQDKALFDYVDQILARSYPLLKPGTPPEPINAPPEKVQARSLPREETTISQALLGETQPQYRQAIQPEAYPSSQSLESLRTRTSELKEMRVLEKKLRAPIIV